MKSISSFSIRKRLLLIHISILLSATRVASASSDSQQQSNNNCVKEFEQCSTPRDCCDSLECITGDWSVTTDSTCLSTKSQQINDKNFSHDERVMLVKKFYDKVLLSESNGNEKSIDDIERLVMKYGKTKFPQLLFRLEKKYDTEFELLPDIMKEDL